MASRHLPTAHERLDREQPLHQRHHTGDHGQAAFSEADLRAASLAPSAAQVERLQPVVGNQAIQRMIQELRQSGSGHANGCGCGCGDSAQKAPAADLPLQRMATAVVQRNKQDYFDGFREGYREGFREGMRDGLVELIGENILDRHAAGNILQSYADDTAIAVESIVNYTGDYKPTDSRHAQRAAGRRMGRGAGFDRGYEIAVSQYGYDRQYSAIPGGNKATAAQDNNGICVYCNANPIADIDHIESLKNHWASRGSAMDKTTRSAETNNTKNLVGACANCNRSKGSKKLGPGWWPAAWGNTWWPFGPNRVKNDNSPPPYW